MTEREKKILELLGKHGLGRMVPDPDDDWGWAWEPYPSAVAFANELLDWADERYGRLVLSKKEAEIFVAALDNPPEPNEALKKLFSRTNVISGQDDKRGLK